MLAVVEPIVVKLREKLLGVQSKLSFEGWNAYPQFRTNTSLGRTALIACTLGILWGIHLLLWIQISIYYVISFWNSRNETTEKQEAKDVESLPTSLLLLLFLWQWCAYSVALTTFHLLEFFITAVYNPSQATTVSFLVNHSTGYTAAVLVTWLEFGLRVLYNTLLVTSNSLSLQQQEEEASVFTRMSSIISRVRMVFLCLGMMLVPVSQVLRSVAMATAGESFNHQIQTSRKENHVLITTGIYRYLRHPSYAGFYYWSIAMQMLLGNIVTTISFAIVSWTFFYRRIAYEEECLCQLFPWQYPSYRDSTYIGIPFLASRLAMAKSEQKRQQQQSSSQQQQQQSLPHEEQELTLDAKDD